MNTTATATRTVSLHDLALKASKVPGEADHATAIANLVDEVAIFTTFEGEQRVGLIEAPITGPASSGGYPVIRFADGMWGRADDLILLVEEGAEDLDHIDTLITAHEAEGPLDPEECRTCHVLFTRRAHANV